MNLEPNNPSMTIKDNLDSRWKQNTVYNHYENPLDFMNDVINNRELAKNSNNGDKYIDQGIEKYKKIDQKNLEYNSLYRDIAEKVKEKLIARGFTTKMLYADVEFTSVNTGVMSKQRVLLGKRDCYFKNAAMTDGKLFHDIYINLSYSGGISDSTIEKNSYGLYALVKELSRLIPMRVIVVNHVGHYSEYSENAKKTVDGTCYSYVLKKFGMPIVPKEFLFFTYDSKRTFGWASYDMIMGKTVDAAVGQPDNTVSIANFNLDKEIDTIWEKFSSRYQQNM